MAALWEAADPREPFFQILGKVWLLSGDELGAWADTAIQSFPGEELVWRHELARAQRWTELSQVLGWTMEEMGA